jgi:hypothetical protein
METARGMKETMSVSGDVFQEWERMGTVNVATAHRSVLGLFQPTSALVLTREVLERIFPLPEQLKSCPDAFITRAACAYGPVATLPLALGVWREHGRNAGKRPEFGLHAFWVPTLMPALNAYYRERGIPVRFVFETPPAEPVEAAAPAVSRRTRAAGLLRTVLPKPVYERVAQCFRKG